MLWICRECGVEAPCEDDVAATWLGWTALDGDTGVCPTCGSSPVVNGGGIRTRQAAQQRQQRSERALALTRALVARSRGRVWDERMLEEEAERLGFSPHVCGTCRSSTEKRCTVCEGTGILWRRGTMLLSSSALVRLAMKPRKP
jgi:hypothetical protein